MGEVRQLFFSKAQDFHIKEIEFMGNKVLIKEPTAGQRAAIYEASTKMITLPNGDKDAKIQHAELQVWAVITCACDTETNEPLFSAADHDALLAAPAQLFDGLAKPCLEMINAEPDSEAKN